MARIRVPLVGIAVLIAGIALALLGRDDYGPIVMSNDSSLVRQTNEENGRPDPGGVYPESRANGPAPPSLSQLSPHAAADEATLQQLLDERGLDDPEVAFATSLVLDLCDAPQFGKPVSVKEMIARWEAGGETQTARIASQALARFCREGLRLDAHEEMVPALSDPTAFLYERSDLLSGNAAFVEQALSNLEADTAAHSDADVFVRDSIKRAAGFFELVELLQIYSQDQRSALLSRALAGFGYPKYPTDEAIATGAILAACRLFGGCGADTIFATMIGFGGGCPYPMSLEESARHRLSPRELAQAEAAARAIVAVRHEPRRNRPDGGS